MMVKILTRLFGWINFRLLAYVGGLVLISLLSFGISLDSFFVADDMWQVNFADEVFNGKTEQIWRNFTSNYLQLPGFGFYRPLLGFTFLFDFWAYRTWAPGWHVTSLLLYISSVVLLFFLFKRLTRTWPSNNSQSASYFAAALFAVSPLHCEDVCWISGRADLLCAPFYLLAIFFVVKSHQDAKRNFYYLALFLFVLAMMSKEIGIGLPLAVFGYYFFWPAEDEFHTPVDMPKYGKSDYQKERISRHKQHLKRVLKKQLKKKKKKREKVKEAELAASQEAEVEEEIEEQELSIKDRFMYALRLSSPFVLIALVYLGIRYLALGTVIGGYGGMIGGALDRHVYLRWFDPVYLERILVPIPAAVNEENLIPNYTIKISLACCLAIAMIRIYAQSNPRKWLGFLFVWIVSCSIPLFKLWGVGAQLETSRLLFFFSMGFSALMPFLMFHPTRKNPTFNLPKNADIALGIVSTFILTVMTIAFGWASLSTSYLWVVAGKEMKAVWQETVKIAKKTDEGKQFIVLGLPKDNHGAHISFNGSTFYHMLRPPFISEDLTNKVLAFDPYIVGPYEVINSTRFKNALSSPRVTAAYVWRRRKRKFERLSLWGDMKEPSFVELPIQGNDKRQAWKFKGNGNATVSDAGVMNIKNTVEGDGLVLKGLNLCPYKYNFFEMDLKIEQNKKDLRSLLPFGLSWNHESTNSKRSDWVLVGLKQKKFSDFKTLTLQPSHYWRWYTEGPIHTLVMRLPDKASISVKNIRLIDASNRIPLLFLKDHKRLNSGEYVIEDINETIELLFDASKVEDSSSIEVEISKPNFFYDSYLMGERETEVAHLLKVGLTKGRTAIKPKYFEKPAYYQIRIRARDQKENPVGAYSDPVTLLRLGPNSGLESYVY